MNCTQTAITEVCSLLVKNGYTVKIPGFNAIDLYLGLPTLPFVFVETNADTAKLARLMENLRFPGMDIADAAMDTPNGSIYFHEDDEPNTYSFPLLSFAYDWKIKRFLDPKGVYPVLRKIRNKEKIILEEEAGFTETGRYRMLMDTAILLARYDFSTKVTKLAAVINEALENLPAQSAPKAEAQRIFLIGLLLSPHPERGLEFLKRTGFLSELWPEIASLDEVDHSKEYHPEGNVWNHTMETFQHRKAHSSGAFDLRLSLGLLVHDMGKPVSASFGSRPFDGHAELGAGAATRFLKRLGFDAAISDDIFYLVKNHMLPAALKRLPLTKTAEIMASPMFPTLMELYRCDESSSFKGLEGYYENSAAYKSYLKHLKNPYRSADGKKMRRKEIYAIFDKI